MSRRRHHLPHHESPHELRLWAIVDSLVTDISEKEAYLAFAREVARAERASYNVHRSSLRVPDYSRRTKRVVMKWFERGLSGHLMWLIGRELLRIGDDHG